MQYFERLSNSEDASETLCLLSKEALGDLKTQYSLYIKRDLYLFAMILDPSQKNKIRDYVQNKFKRHQVSFFLAEDLFKNKI